MLLKRTVSLFFGYAHFKIIQIIYNFYDFKMYLFVCLFRDKTEWAHIHFWFIQMFPWWFLDRGCSWELGTEASPKACVLQGYNWLNHKCCLPTFSLAGSWTLELEPDIGLSCSYVVFRNLACCVKFPPLKGTFVWKIIRMLKLLDRMGRKIYRWQMTHRKINTFFFSFWCTYSVSQKQEYKFMTSK